MVTLLSFSPRILVLSYASAWDLTEAEVKEMELALAPELLTMPTQISERSETITALLDVKKSRQPEMQNLQRQATVSGDGG